MEYTTAIFRDAVERFGEVMFVLDSDREYIVHGIEGFEFEHYGEKTVVRVEGMHDDEYVVAEFPLDSIEHHFTHKEL